MWIKAATACGFVSSEADFASIAGRSEKSQPRMTLHLHSIYNNHAKWASSCNTSADINAQSNPNQLLITWRWPRWPARPLGGNEPSGSILNIAEAQSNSPSISALVYAADHWRHSFKVLDEAKETLYEMWGGNKTVWFCLCRAVGCEASFPPRDADEMWTWSCVNLCT